MAVRFPAGLFGREVEPGLFAGASAGDVAPFVKCALVLEEHEGALDRRSLGGVAGERVAVLEVLGRVTAVDGAKCA